MELPLRRAQRLNVGLLHLGIPAHGVRRYGRILAAELTRLPGVSVLEHEVTLTATGLPATRSALGAVRALASANVTIVPYCRNGLWSPTRARIAQLLAVHAGLARRTVAVLHDVYSPGGRRQTEWWAVAVNGTLPGAVVLHGEHDRRALAGLPGIGRAVVIPHFIEQRPAIERGAARERLAADPRKRVIGMIGWIHPRKNYELAIRSLALLDDQVELWLVGGTPGADQTYLRGVLRLAAQLGVDRRVLVTGYVSERELEWRLAALDLGLCPYHDASASGSMSTLLSARRPVLASDVALARELRTLAPAAIRVSASADPQALAEAAGAMLESPPAGGEFEALLADRSPSVTADRYLRVLREVAG